MEEVWDITFVFYCWFFLWVGHVIISGACGCGLWALGGLFVCLLVPLGRRALLPPPTPTSNHNQWQTFSHTLTHIHKHTKHSTQLIHNHTHRRSQITMSSPSLLIWDCIILAFSFNCHYKCLYFRWSFLLRTAKVNAIVKSPVIAFVVIIVVVVVFCVLPSLLKKKRKRKKIWWTCLSCPDIQKARNTLYHICI